MPNDRWDNITNDTNDLIQKAIESGNYNSLKRDVTSTIEKAVQSAIEIGRRTVENPPAGRNFSNYAKNGSRTVKVNVDGNTVEINQSYADRVRKPNTERASRQDFSFKSPIKLGGGKYISGFRLSFGGYMKAIWGGLIGAGSFAAAGDLLSGRDIFASLLGVAFGLACFYMCYSGVRTLQNKGKFKRYVDTLSLSKTGDYASISDLAFAANENEKKTLKRVKFMIRKRWFKEGYLDRFEKTLMTSKDAYKLYKNSEDSLLRRQKEEEERAAKEEQKNGKLPKEVREVLETGADYLRQMKVLNDRIPGEEVSDKISKIEALTARILARIESHPESVDETKQMMKYYLPMIIKLLNAYADMDEQPKPGQNIENSKKEIEGVLDELNLAFERLLDDLYKDTAWDVSSDISVLNAMLKRAGLKGSDFTQSGSSETEEDGNIKLKL